MVEVVLPTPPFWLHIAMTLAGPCVERGCGSGIFRGGRPVKPTPGLSSSLMAGPALWWRTSAEV
jgi:hypothetical protein